jgi:hypothetical protein
MQEIKFNDKIFQKSYDKYFIESTDQRPDGSTFMVDQREGIQSLEDFIDHYNIEDEIKDLIHQLKNSNERKNILLTSENNDDDIKVTLRIETFEKNNTEDEKFQISIYLGETLQKGQQAFITLYKRNDSDNSTAIRNYLIQSFISAFSGEGINSSDYLDQQANKSNDAVNDNVYKNDKETSTSTDQEKLPDSFDKLNPENLKKYNPKIKDFTNFIGNKVSDKDRFKQRLHSNRLVGGTINRLSDRMLALSHARTTRSRNNSTGN